MTASQAVIRMQTERIRALIEDGKTKERQSGLLRRALIDLASVNGRSVTELEVQKVINFVGEYIEHAPALMKLIEEAAANSGAEDDVRPILDATESYFLAPDDTIPDDLGLVGLVDDAYLTHSLMQLISDKYRSQSGKSLLPLETHKDNAFIRRLIGEPFASILDDQVSATLGRPGMQQNIDRISMALGQMNLSVRPDPIWGTSGAPEVADARVEAIGVF